MNVLKALNNSRFNDISMQVESMTIINPCELQVTAYNINHKIKISKDYWNIPFRCILNNHKAILHLTDIQNITASIERNKITCNNSNIAFSEPCKKVTIGLHKELSVEQIRQLVSLFDAIVLNEYLF